MYVLRDVDFANGFDLDKQEKLQHKSPLAHQQIRMSLNFTVFEMTGKEMEIRFQDKFGLSTTFCITMEQEEGEEIDILEWHYFYSECPHSYCSLFFVLLAPAKEKRITKAMIFIIKPDSLNHRCIQCTPCK